MIATGRVLFPLTFRSLSAHFPLTSRSSVRDIFVTTGSRFSRFRGEKTISMSEQNFAIVISTHFDMMKY